MERAFNWAVVWLAVAQKTELPKAEWLACQRSDPSQPVMLPPQVP
jgi:hypothetical protein